MRKLLLTLSIGTTLILSSNVSASPDGEHKTPEASKDLSQIKQLAGTWKGAADEPNSKDSVVVTYRVTSGGSAVVETISPGTPHEMESVYFDQNKKLAMTHYCMLGNHPKLVATSASPEKIALSLDPKDPLAKNGEAHMHALTITFDGPDKITQTWSSVDAKGKPGKSVVFNLTRVKQG